jgi:hypothetical protein
VSEVEVAAPMEVDVQSVGRSGRNVRAKFIRYGDYYNNQDILPPKEDMEKCASPRRRQRFRSNHYMQCKDRHDFVVSDRETSGTSWAEFLSTSVNASL